MSNIHRFGWFPDYRDHRDYTEDHKTIKPLLDKLKGSNVIPPIPKVDLSSYCPPVQDQDNLGSCTAQAVIGMVEYFEKRSFGTFIDASNLFLYKTTRNLDEVTGDAGASLRTTLGALRLFGVPPERYWKYDIKLFDIEPPAFCYALAGNFKNLAYFRHDATVTDTQKILESVKAYLRLGIPSAFGFSVYSSYKDAEKTGLIPYPAESESQIEGHAVLSVGYDDDMVITNPINKATTKGALMIRNSWGSSWGIDGYGYLPYDYVLNQLATDFWSVLQQDWIDSEMFIV